MTNDPLKELLDAAWMGLHTSRWSASPGYVGVCPWCGNTARENHRSDCAMILALTFTDWAAYRLVKKEEWKKLMETAANFITAFEEKGDKSEWWLRGTFLDFKAATQMEKALEE